MFARMPIWHPARFTFNPKVNPNANINVNLIMALRPENVAKEGTAMLLRIDKYLADAGLGTRSAVQELLRRGRVRVNGETVKDGKKKIDPDNAEVMLDGKPVCYEEYSYYILNKPAGILSAAKDKKERTVTDLIPQPRPRGLFPVGRLDRDTVGLLLITNDGDLSHRLLAPGKHVPKTYRAIVSGNIPEDAEERFREGIDIGDEKPTAPTIYRYGRTVSWTELREITGAEQREIAGAEQREITGTELREITGTEQNAAETDEGLLHEIFLTLTEGRYHEVKRMVAALGCKVEGLERIGMGNLKLPEDLERGCARRLNPDELKSLLS